MKQSLLIAAVVLSGSMSFAGQMVSHSGYCTLKDLAEDTCGATSLAEATATSKESMGSCYVKPVFAEGHGRQPVGYVCQVIGD